jgi:hypothetical protein
MWRFVFIAFLIAHGAVHLAIWTTPASTKADAPFDVRHSWVLGDRRGLPLGLAIGAALFLIASGVSLWGGVAWWRPVAVTGLMASFALMVLFFHPWFLPIQAVNAALVVALVWLAWPSQSLVGAWGPL